MVATTFSPVHFPLSRDHLNKDKTQIRWPYRPGPGHGHSEEGLD